MKIEDFLTYIPDGFIYSYVDLSDLVIMYQNKVNKVIEYINNELLPYGDEWHWDAGSIRDYVCNLLDILKGSDNNGM